MIESNPLLSQKMQNWSHLLVKTCARLDERESRVGEEFEKARSQRRVEAHGEPLDCIFFCYKESNRVQVFRERNLSGGRKFFHRDRRGLQPTETFTE